MKFNTQIYRTILFLAGFYLLGISVFAQKRERQIISRLNEYFLLYETTYTTPKDRCKVEKVKVNTSHRTLTIYVNELFSGQSFDKELVDDTYRQVKKLLPAPYSRYKITIYAKKHKIDDLVNAVSARRQSDDRQLGDKVYEGAPWVRRHLPYSINKGLANRHFSVWASHGRYYKHEKEAWTWQRPYLYCTTEDLFTQTFVVPFLIPMLENAGAYVFTPRERDWQTQELIVDNDIPQLNGSYREYNQQYEWMASDGGFALLKDVYRDGDNPFTHGTSRKISATNKRKDVSEIYWTPSFVQSGNYAVYVSYASLPTNIPDAKYTICHRGVKTEYTVNQQMGAGTWVYLGTFDFDADNPQDNFVSLSNYSTHKGTVTADAVRFGGGMGNIARGDSLNAVVSGMPRYLEGARYTAQWYGMPDSIYSPKDGTNDYADDINTRSNMTNYLAGGSMYCPGDSGLNVPIELSFALHSDAGIRFDSTYIGSLGICTTDFEDGVYPSGLSRLSSRDLCDVMLTQLENDLTKTYGEWRRRAIYDRNYSETRQPKVPAMILEILSHQNFKDMVKGHDPMFKFTVSRAIYKAILKYSAYQHRADYVVQPLPVTDFRSSLNMKNNEVVLEWNEVVDPLETTAVPNGYMVYVKVGDKGYDNGTFVRNNRFVHKVSPDKMYAYKVTAVNDGGESFPTEELCAMISSKSKAKVLIVDGFQRVAGPQVVQTDTTQGFDISIDYGVPYYSSPGLCGQQLVFNVNNTNTELWGHSDNALETIMMTGNHFNHSLVHGTTIAALQDYSFASASRSAVESGAVLLNEYDVVDLILGLQKNDGYSTRAYPTLTSAMCDALREYTRLHGRLLVSGAYLARDQRTSETVDFLLHTLKVKAYAPLTLSDGAQTIGMNSTFALNTTLNDIHYPVRQVDCLEPEVPAFSTLLFSGSEMSAAVAYPGSDYKAITLGFPFECLRYASDRERMMGAFLKFLLSKLN